MNTLAPANNVMDRFTAEGKLCRRPLRHYATATVLDIDLDRLATHVKSRLKPLFTSHGPLLAAYPSLTYETHDLCNSIDTMVDIAVYVLYNKLRSIAERFSSTTRTTRMNPRAPFSDDFEFPTFLASTFSSFGPLRITDGPQDILVIYAPAAANMRNYGRAAPLGNIAIGRYDRLLDAMRRSRMDLSKIDVHGSSQGSFFSTLIVTEADNEWNFCTTAHHTNYESLDCLRAWLCLHPDIDSRCVSYCGFVVDVNTTPDVVNAVAADLPNDIAAEGVTRPIGFVFPCNEFGIRPAVAAHDRVPAAPAAVYILGRGSTLYYSSVIGQRLTADDMFMWAYSIICATVQEPEVLAQEES